ncbi:MAG TPA: hypothetical protein VK921_00480, partial [Anditalea sp.]|nr:hypothetical protein [Anditalea sp.]
MGLDIDEWVYGKVVKYFKRSKKAASEKMVHKVDLEEIKPRLTLLARAVSGHAVEIFPAEREGGYKNHNYFLPISFAELPTYEENLSFYFFRILYLSAQSQLGFNWEEESDNLILSRQKAVDCAPAVLEKLYEDFPIARHLHDKIKEHFDLLATPKCPADYSWIYGKWMYSEA